MCLYLLIAGSINEVYRFNIEGSLGFDVGELLFTKLVVFSYSTCEVFLYCFVGVGSYCRCFSFPASRYLRLMYLGVSVSIGFLVMV